MRYFEKGKHILPLALLILFLILVFRSCNDNPSLFSNSQNDDRPMTVEEPTRIPSDTDGHYDTGPQTWTSQHGVTFSAGVESSELVDAIYLNIRCSAAHDGNEIGYYIQTDRGLLEYSDETSVLTDCDSGNNAQHSNFFIPRRYYSSVASMEYIDDSHYGVRWSDDKSDGTTSDAIITVRAINLKTAEFLGIFDIAIEYNDEKHLYWIDSINSADVATYKLLSDQERTAAIQSAIDFASEKIFPNSGWEAAARAGAIVHKTNRTYFARFLNVDGKSDKSVNYWTCQDTFAVTFPVSYYGYGTVYLAPKTECIGLTEPKAYGSNSLDLQIYGYDPINPRNEETIVAPIDFFLQ